VLQKLKKVILEDELGICADLDREMDALVGTYQCEWTAVVKDKERRKQFRQFVNTVSIRSSCRYIRGLTEDCRMRGSPRSNP
jgi:nitrite reductase (NAD(P)H)